MSIGTTAAKEAYQGFSKLVNYAEKSFAAKGVGLTQIWGEFEKLEDQFVTIAGKKAGEKASHLEKFASQLIMTIDWLVQKTGLRDAFHAIENATKAVNDAVNDGLDKVKQNTSNSTEKTTGVSEKDAEGFLTRIKNSILEFFGYGKKEAAEKVEQQGSKEGAKFETSTDEAAKTPKAPVKPSEEEAEGFLSKKMREIKEFFLGKDEAVVDKTKKELEEAAEDQIGDKKPADTSKKLEPEQKTEDIKSEVPELDSSKLGDRKPLDSNSDLTSKVDTSSKSQDIISGRDAIKDGKFYAELPPGDPRQVQKKSIENVEGNGLLEQKQPALNSAIQQGNMDNVSKKGTFNQFQEQQVDGKGKLVQQGQAKRVGEDLDFSQVQKHNGGLTSGVQQAGVHHVGGTAAGKQIQEVAPTGDSIQELFISNIKNDANITQEQIAKQA